jgi:hypothetical protein
LHASAEPRVAHDDRRDRAVLDVLGQTARWRSAAASATPADRV